MGLERPRPIEATDLQLADGFDCGTPVLNEWLRVHAWTNHNSGSARVYVCIDSDADAIAGYYSLSAGAVEHARAPRRVSRGLARHPIPVVLIGRLAVERRYGSRGIGRFLVRDAFEHILESADVVGTRAVMVRAKTPEAAEFYRKLGFAASDSDPMRFFHLLKDVRKSILAARKP
ncbi:MAG TPA: GNAT family N-acetyltransferase [Candidatus Binataceae bacterium]